MQADPQGKVYANDPLLFKIARQQGLVLPVDLGAE
jgi:hypothetical protein